MVPWPGKHPVVTQQPLPSAGQRNAAWGFVILQFALIAGIAITAVPAQAATDCGDYFNSTEPGCDGSDPDILFCDDFDDGSWHYNDGNSCGTGSGADDDGWIGWRDAENDRPDLTGNGAFAHGPQGRRD